MKFSRLFFFCGKCRWGVTCFEVRSMNFVLFSAVSAVAWRFRDKIWKELDVNSTQGVDFSAAKHVGRNNVRYPLNIQVRNFLILSFYLPARFMNFSPQAASKCHEFQINDESLSRVRTFSLVIFQFTSDLLLSRRLSGGDDDNNKNCMQWGRKWRRKKFDECFDTDNRALPLQEHLFALKYSHSQLWHSFGRRGEHLYCVLARQLSASYISGVGINYFSLFG